MLEIRKDGSGSLIFGSNPTDVAIIAKGSLKPQEIYNALAPTLQVISTGPNSIAVTLRKAGEVSASALYSNNRAVIDAIFDTAKTSAKPINKARFEQLLRETPVRPPAP